MRRFSRSLFILFLAIFAVERAGAQVPTPDSFRPQDISFEIESGLTLGIASATLIVKNQGQEIARQAFRINDLDNAFPQAEQKKKELELNVEVAKKMKQRLKLMSKDDGIVLVSILPDPGVSEGITPLSPRLSPKSPPAAPGTHSAPESTGR